MRALIAGGTGLIGQALANDWLQQGHDVTILGRDAEKIKTIFADRVKALSWSQFDDAPSMTIKDFECIVNLCGANIGEKNWSKSRKKSILDSRIIPTEKIANACAELGADSPRLFNASAIGVYGLQEARNDNLPDAFDESSDLPNPARDFLSEVGTQWEKACNKAVKANVPVVFCRFGVVLDKQGGALPKMAMPFQWFIGGKVGSGDQPLTWVSLSDVVRAFNFLIDQPELSGPFNIVAMQAVKQKEFAHSLARRLNRPCWLPVPAFTLKLLFGQMAEELLLNGQHVVPTRLAKAGFEFQYPALDSALKAIYS